MKIRINKYLSEHEICSRRKADELIEDRLVFVNGLVAQKGQLVDDFDEIKVFGKKIDIKKAKEVVIVFHKPVGLITSVDPNAQDNVIEHISYPTKIFPIGRLDVASSGLLLLTNNGDLSEKITHPRYDHEKEYVVEVDRILDEKDLETMRNGMIILGEKTKRADVKKISSMQFSIILKEGKNRQIRRMCEELDYRVKSLKRIRVMNIELGKLPVGKYRELSNNELNQLKKILKI